MENLPVCKKCCFCVPLRYGLMTWGYIKLVIAILVVTLCTLFVLVLYPYIDSSTVIISLLVFAVLVTEIVLHIIFIMGAHDKNVKMLTVYYYYAIVMWAVTILAGIVCTILLIITIPVGNTSMKSICFALEGVSFLCAIVIQTFLLLSLRSEIIKLRSNCPYRFVKNENDPEGTITTVNYEEEISKENDTERINERERS